MKKILKVILLSCGVGSILACLFFGSIKNKAEAKSKPIVYTYQVGVFKNQDNAENLANNYSYAKVVKDKDLYRVLVGITINNKNLLSEIFNKKNYDYYIKEIAVNEEYLEAVIKYDEILSKTSLDMQEEIIKTMVEGFIDEL